MPRFSHALSALVVALSCWAFPAGAEDPPESDAAPLVSPSPSSPDLPRAVEPRPGSWLAAGAAVVPGLLLHGSGHFVMGDTPSALRLLAMQGVGMAGIIGGVAILGSVGGSEKLAPLYVPVAIGGLGLFGISWLADMVGAARGHVPWPEPFGRASALTATAGYAGLYGSPHAFTQLGRLGLDWTGERWSLGGEGLLQPGLAYFSATGRAGWQAWSRPGDPVTRLSLLADFGYQRFAEEGFSMSGGRGYGELRWNLGDLLPTLRNAWILGRLGFGFDRIDVHAAEASDDGLPYLVADIGLGLRASERVQLELAYRQRKGELPGGLVTPGGLDGFFGMLELQGRVRLDERFSLLPGIKVGNGVMPWLSLESQLF